MYLISRKNNIFELQEKWDHYHLIWEKLRKEKKKKRKKSSPFYKVNKIFEGLLLEGVYFCHFVNISKNYEDGKLTAQKQKQQHWDQISENAKQQTKEQLTNIQTK